MVLWDTYNTQLYQTKQKLNHNLHRDTNNNNNKNKQKTKI